jgi:hypothetical protein
VLDPALLDAGIQAIRLGIPVQALITAQSRVLELVEQAAQAYVAMFRDTVWRDFVAAGAPEDQWPRVQGTVEQIQPVAAQALLASFRAAMASAVSETLDQALAGELDRSGELPGG